MLDLWETIMQSTLPSILEGSKNRGVFKSKSTFCITVTIFVLLHLLKLPTFPELPEAFEVPPFFSL